MKIACLGDSITYGYGLNRLNNECWVDRTAIATGIDFLNFGISGDTTAGMLQRLHSDVMPCRPEIVVLMGGTNDICITGDYRVACANMVAMIKHMLELDITTVIGIPLPLAPEDINVCAWDWGRDNQHNAEQCEEYAQWLRCYCLDKHIDMVDFRKIFIDGNGKIKRELLQDGIHPTTKGHAQMSLLMQDVLAQMGYGKERP